jgi:hypothetical protein
MSPMLLSLSHVITNYSVVLFLCQDAMCASNIWTHLHIWYICENHVQHTCEKWKEDILRTRHSSTYKSCSQNQINKIDTGTVRKETKQNNECSLMRNWVKTMLSMKIIVYWAMGFSILIANHIYTVPQHHTLPPAQLNNL